MGLSSFKFETVHSKIKGISISKYKKDKLPTV
jgi:hypothetical protein